MDNEKYAELEKEKDTLDVLQRVVLVAKKKWYKQVGEEMALFFWFPFFTRHV